MAGGRREARSESVLRDRVPVLVELIQQTPNNQYAACTRAWVGRGPTRRAEAGGGLAPPRPLHCPLSTKQSKTSSPLFYLQPPSDQAAGLRVIVFSQSPDAGCPCSSECALTVDVTSLHLNENAGNGCGRGEIVAQKTD